MYDEKRVAVILAAAGSGTRMGPEDKLYLQLEGLPVLARSVSMMENCSYVDEIVISLRAGQEDRFQREVGERIPVTKLRSIVPGGAERTDSVYRALNAVSDDADLILIHDGARPLVDEALMERVLEAASRHGAAVPAVPLKDTVKTVESCDDGLMVTATPDRARLRAVQTPQGFHAALLRDAYHQCLSRPDASDLSFTDDASLVEAIGHPVYLVDGSEENMKLTTPPDLERAASILRHRAGGPDCAADRPPAVEPPQSYRPPLIRTGIGYDVHAFAHGRKLILGGVEVPYERGLEGHSDADVLVHAIMDALLGACALGDIGQHFPDTDPAYRGADSLHLLKAVTELLHRKGWQPLNIDAIVIAQRPKLASYIPDMRERIAQAAGLAAAAVSVKATTTEHLGFEGRGEGIAAQAVVTVQSAVTQEG